ncbi:MAG: hypothetical protein LBP99_06250 [Azoarcus sp.]|jgi:uncharacterized protein YbaR (Trm112 family)|nr:hypothetical protein [Azoarcus sp.]
MVTSAARNKFSTLKWIVFDLYGVCKTGNVELNARLQFYFEQLDTINNRADLLAFALILPRIFLQRYELPIYHYTSPEAFFSMFSGDKNNKEENKKSSLCLHLSRFDLLNDMSEGQEVIHFLSYAGLKLFSEHAVSKDENGLYRIWENIPELLKACTRNQSHNEWYVACFSSDRDSLPMWNYYLKNGRYEGYNIGLKPEYMKNLLIGKVVYEDKDKEKLCYAFIKKANECIKNDKSDIPVEQILYSFIVSWRLLFKASYFKHEEEARIIIVLPQEGKEYKVDYKVSGGLLVPYIKEYFYPSIEDGELVLDSVTIAPALHLSQKEAAKETTIKFLHDRGFKIDIDKVMNSVIPVRF